MKSQLLFLLIILACMYLSLAQGSYNNCCLGHVKALKKNVRKNVVSFRMQETDGACNIRAVVFEMKRKDEWGNPRTICANPDIQWVQTVMASVQRPQI